MLPQTAKRTTVSMTMRLTTLEFCRLILQCEVRKKMLKIKIVLITMSTIQHHAPENRLIH